MKKYFSENESEFYSKKEIYNSLPIGILFFDENLIIKFVNQNIYNFNIIDKKILKEESVSILDPNLFTQKNIIEEINNLHLGNPFEKIIKSTKTSDGGEIIVCVKGLPIFIDDKFKGGLIVIEDFKLFNDAVNIESDLNSKLIERFTSKLFDLFLLIEPNGNIFFKKGSFVEKYFSKKKNEKEFIQNYFKSTQFEELLTTVNEQNEYVNSTLTMSIGKNDFFVNVQFILIETEEKKIIAIVIKDITEEKNKIALVELELSELRKNQSITEAITDAIISLNEKGEIIFWNRSAEKLFGYSRSEVYGKSILKITRAFEQKELSQIVAKLRATPVYKSIFNFITKDKNERIGEFTFTSLQNESSIVDQILLVCADITESFFTEQSLKKSESLFKTIVSNCTAMICTFDDKAKLTYANKNFSNSFGINSIEGVSLFSLFDSSENKINKTNFVTLAKNNETNIELARFNSDNTKQIFSAKFSTIPLEENSSQIYLGIFYDVTEKKKFEQELFLMRSVFASTNDGIALEFEDEFILVNDSFANILGYEVGTDLIGKLSTDFFVSEEKEKLSNFLKKKKKSGKLLDRSEFIAKKLDGSIITLEVSITNFSFDEKQFNVLIIRDITERKIYEKTLAESEEKYRSITENIDDFFWIGERINNKIRIVFFTKSIEKVTGYSSEEIRRSSHSFFRGIHYSDFPKVKEKLKKFYANSYKNSDEVEFRFIHKQGQTIWLRDKVTVVRDIHGVVQKIYGLISNISLQKKAEDELKKSADDLKKLNDTKDRFISIISHDLRTPFSSILGFTDLLINDDELSSDERHKYVEYIQESANGMLTFVNSLLDWTRIQTGRIKFEPRIFGLHEIVNSTLVTLSGEALKKGINLKNNVEKELDVFVDQTLIIQALINLISNALKFSYSGGAITVSATDSNQSRFIEVSVTDTGVGISEENQSKLFGFDSKFTSEGTAGEKGSGLGLSLVKEIIEKHGGKIWLNSKVGAGTTFFFQLPRASSTILLVDDSNTDRVLYTKIIKNLIDDYEIVTARDGKEAIEYIRTSPPALVITDHMMPNMNGYELVVEISKLNLKGKPKVIVLSSELSKGDVYAYNDLGVEYLFPKPANLNNLKSAIEKLLKQIPK
ncbi:MAG: hypothetical protein C0425_03805 [Chlorobiaceae bacterium]|nr:hypothetical protein [Chlorobiaceae bacterium]MBA4309440.1 hypothetical protein [Chlorobiaceae bacterium]